MANALFSSYADYILWDAVWSSSVAPITNYSVDTFSEMRPDKRVKFNVKTVTITATKSGSAQRGDVVAVAMSNLDPGTSPTILRLTNEQGLDVTIELPVVPADGIPLTAVLDFRQAANASTPATTWNWIIANNSADVTLGALLWVGQLREFTANFRPEFELGETHFNGGDTNVYGIENTIRYRTRQRWATFSVPTRDAQRDTFFEWARASEGGGLPSLFWPDPSVNDALLGKWPNQFSSRWVIANYSPMDGIQYNEMNKGLPLL